MSRHLASQHPANAVLDRDTPPATSSGADDAAAVGRIFRDVTAAFGIDGAPVFERLSAGESLADALSLPPPVADAMYARAHGWFSSGRIDRALTLFRALCLLDEKNADYWVGYGVCLRMTAPAEDAAQLDTAWRALEVAALLRPEWPIPHFHAFDLSLFQQRWERARLCLAAYEERATPDVPSAIVQEAQRLRTILEARAPEPYPEAARTASARPPEQAVE